MQAAMAFSKQALSVAPAAGEGAELGANLMEALVLIRTRQGTRGNKLAQNVIAKLEQTNLILAASSARLMLAEALAGPANSNSVLRDSARGMALQALVFFEPRRILESVWRAHSVIAQASSRDAREIQSHRIAADSALAQLKTHWPHESVESYLQRTDLKLLSTVMKF